MRSVFCFFLTLLISSSVQAEDQTIAAPKSVVPKPAWTAHILRRKPVDQKITGLSILVAELPVMLVPKSDKLRPLTEVPILYDRPGWILLAQGQPITEVSDSAVEIKIPLYLNGRVNQLSLEAKGPAGERENETIFIVSPQAQEFAVLNSWDRLVISFGLTSLSYFQTAYGRYVAMTGLFGLQYASPPETRWGLLGSADITAITFTESPLKAGAQIAEGKFGLTFGLRPDQLHSPWRHTLLAGGSFITMNANSAPFGFQNLIAPEFGVRSRYIKNSRDAYIADVRYIALAEPRLDFRGGLALGFGFSRILPTFRRIEPSISYSLYRYSPEPNKSVHVDLISFRIGYSL